MFWWYFNKCQKVFACTRWVKYMYKLGENSSLLFFLQYRLQIAQNFHFYVCNQRSIVLELMLDDIHCEKLHCAHQTAIQWLWLLWFKMWSASQSAIWLSSVVFQSYLLMYVCMYTLGKQLLITGFGKCYSIGWQAHVRWHSITYQLYL